MANRKVFRVDDLNYQTQVITALNEKRVELEKLKEKIEFFEKEQKEKELSLIGIQNLIHEENQRLSRFQDESRQVIDLSKQIKELQEKIEELRQLGQNQIIENRDELNRALSGLREKQADLYRQINELERLVKDKTAIQGAIDGSISELKEQKKNRELELEEQVQKNNKEEENINSKRTELAVILTQIQNERKQLEESIYLAKQLSISTNTERDSSLLKLEARKKVNNG